MPQVPYSGTPTVGPEDQPIPYRQSGASVDAFGGAVAQATQHLGQVSEQAGQEMFQRAYAMQELNQRAEANKALADYSEDIGKQFAQFDTLEGKAKVDAYQPFLDGLSKSRQQFRDGLSSPYAQMEFDNGSRSEQARMTMYGARGAGEANKKFITDAATAKIKTAGDSLYAMPDDEDAAKNVIQGIKDDANHLADVAGAAPEKRQQMVTEAVSNALYKRGIGLAKTQPFAAQQMMDKYGDQMTAEDKARFADYNEKQKLNVGSRHEASEVMAGNDNSFGSGVIDIGRARDAIRQMESSGNYSITVPTKDGDTAYGAYQIKGSNLQPWLKEAGMASMTPQEFLNNKQAQDQLFEFKFGQYQKQYGSANAAANAWFTGKPNPDPGVSDGNTTAGQYATKFNAMLARSAGPGDLDKAARARADKVDPGNNQFADYLSNHVQQLYAEQERIKRDDERNNMETLDGALSGGQDNRVPTSLQDLMADPKAESAYNGLNQAQQRRVQNILASNARGDVAWDPQGQRLGVYQNLVGLSRTNPDAFMHTDVMATEMPMSAKRELLQMQSQIYKKEDATPQVTRALKVLGPSLAGAGLTGEGADKESYQEFVGGLHNVLTDLQANNGGKPLTDDDFKTAGAGLLQNTKTGGGFLGLRRLMGSDNTPLYHIEVPKEAAAAIANDPQWKKYGIQPTQEMIHAAYVAAQYKQLYGKKTAPSQPNPGPQVPISE